MRAAMRGVQGFDAGDRQRREHDDARDQTDPDQADKQGNKKRCHVSSVSHYKIKRET